MRTQTAGERWLAKKMKDPIFAAEFKKARDEVDVVDGFIRTLDARRTEIGMSKEELARRVSQNSSALRRLLTSGGNPSLSQGNGALDEKKLGLRDAGGHGISSGETHRSSREPRLQLVLSTHNAWQATAGDPSQPLS